MNKLIVAAFPAAAIKFMVQSDDEEVSSQQLCFQPDFEKTFNQYLDDKYDIKEIYVLGPKTYIGNIISMIKGLTNLPVIEEGI